MFLGADEKAKAGAVAVKNTAPALSAGTGAGATDAAFEKQKAELAEQLRRARSTAHGAVYTSAGPVISDAGATLAATAAPVSEAGAAAPAPAEGPPWWIVPAVAAGALVLLTMGSR